MIRIGLGAESPTDARRVSDLVDRLITTGVDWIAPEILDAYRVWTGLDGADHMDLHRAKQQATARGIRIYGHFGGEPAEEDAAMIRAALTLFAEEPSPPAAVVIARDTDHRPARLDGFAQATRTCTWPFLVIGALAIPEIEAWLALACAPETPAEKPSHIALRQSLGFDPTLTPERISSRRYEDKKDTKLILDAITAQGRTADERWRAVPLALLRERGGRCGLTAFLDEVEDKLLPRFGERLMS